MTHMTHINHEEAWEVEHKHGLHKVVSAFDRVVRLEKHASAESDLGLTDWPQSC